MAARRAPSQSKGEQRREKCALAARPVQPFPPIFIRGCNIWPRLLETRPATFVPTSSARGWAHERTQRQQPPSLHLSFPLSLFFALSFPPFPSRGSPALFLPPVLSPFSPFSVNLSPPLPLSLSISLPRFPLLRSSPSFFRSFSFSLFPRASCSRFFHSSPFLSDPLSLSLFRSFPPLLLLYHNERPRVRVRVVRQ